LCLSVVSFSSIQYLERSLLLVVTSASDSPVHTMRFCSVVFGLYPSTDVQACCHKQDSLMLALSQMLPLSVITLHNAWRSSSHVSQGQILVENCNFCSSSRVPLQYCHNVWCGKTRMMWLWNGEKIMKLCLLVSTEYMNMMDRQMPSTA